MTLPERKLLLILLLIPLAGVIGQETRKLPSIEQMLQEPEDSIDIGIACLSLAQEFYPDLNPAFFLYTYDYLAHRFLQQFGHISDPEQKVRALNTFLYQEGRWNDSLVFSYDRSDPGARKRDNRFINGYLASRKGSCVTMPMLYVILGERLGMPIYAVRAPNHFFVRYFPKKISARWQANIEATSGGGCSSDEEYTIDLKIPQVGIAKGMYLRTLTKKEYLASLLLINVAEYIERKNFDKAERYADLALLYDTTLATAVWARGLVHYHRAMLPEEASDGGDHEVQINKHLAVWEESKAKAKAMGMALVPPGSLSKRRRRPRYRSIKREALDMKGSRLFLLVVVGLFILSQHQAEARYYDARVGRFLSVDPLAEKYPQGSPYLYSQNSPLLRVDPDGKSDLTFFRKTNVLVLYSNSGKELGRWSASNKPVAGSRHTHGIFHKGQQIEPGSYSFKDTDAPNMHGTSDDSRNGAYGEHGIFRLNDFKDSENDNHDNVGVHSGREDKGGWEYQTYGCIRTTEDAMEMITNTAEEDPLRNLRVVDPPVIDSPVTVPKVVPPIVVEDEPASA